MDFQVVVLGGGVSKKLLPLVSQVHKANASNLTNLNVIVMLTRFFVLQELPNALLPVANRPVLSYVLEYLDLSNLKDLIVVISLLAILHVICQRLRVISELVTKFNYRLLKAKKRLFMSGLGFRGLMLIAFTLR